MRAELFQILQPRINARVLEIVHNHLSDEQLGLLLVKMINPYVVLSQQEEAKLRGVDRKTLRGMKARGELADDLSSQEPVNAKNSPKCPKHGQGIHDAPHGGKSPKMKR